MTLHCREPGLWSRTRRPVGPSYQPSSAGDLTAMDALRGREGQRLMVHAVAGAPLGLHPPAPDDPSPDRVRRAQAPHENTRTRHMQRTRETG